MTTPATMTDVAADPETLDAANEAMSSQDHMFLEASCVDLLGRLEQFLCQATEARQENAMSETVSHANNMLLSLLDHAETHLKGDTLDEAHARIASAYEATQTLSDTISSRSWSAVRRVIGGSSASEIDVLQAHAKAGEAITVVIISVLGGSIQDLGVESSMGTEMIQSLQLLIDEMEKGW